MQLRSPDAPFIQASDEALDYIASAFAAQLVIREARTAVAFDRAAHVLRTAGAWADRLTGADWKAVAQYRDQHGSPVPALIDLHNHYNARFRAYTRRFAA